MARLERFDELAKGCGSTLLERQLDFYLARSVAKDKDLDSDTSKVCSKLADSIIEIDGFIKELSFIEGRVEAVETAKYLRQRMHKDTLRLTDLMISRRETELCLLDKEKFAEKLKGSLPF
jgi:hypothetical protein